MSEGQGAAGAQTIVRGGPEPLGRVDILIGLAVAAVAIAFQWPIHDRWLALQDEGYILAIADDLNRGKVLYRDVTSDAPFPGAFYLLSWWFQITGPSIESSRILAMGGFALYCSAIYRICRELLSRRWCWGVVIALLCYRVWAFPHWHIYSYSLVSAVCMTVAVALTCAYRRTRSLRYLVIAGLLAGAGIMSKQNYGLAVTGSLGLALLLFPWLDSKRPAGFFRTLVPGATVGLSALAVIVPWFLWFASHGALEDMYEQTWVFPFTLMSQLSFTELPDLWPLWGQDANLRAEIGSYFPAIVATLWWYPCPGCFASDMSRGPLYQSTAFWDISLKLFYWAPLFAYFAAGVSWGTEIVRARLRGDSSDASERRLLMLAFAGGFLIAFNKPRDWVHLMMVYPPCLALGAVLLRDAMRSLPLPARIATGTLATAGLAGTMALSVLLMIDLRRQIDWPLGMARGGVYADPQNGPILSDVVHYLNTDAPALGAVPSWPVQPMISFLAGRETAGGYYVIWPSQSKNRDKKIIEDFESSGISHVIYSVSQFEHLGPFEQNAPTLYRYLVDNFEVDRVFSREPNGPIVLGLAREKPLGPVDTRISLEDQLQREIPGASWESWPFETVLTHPLGRRARVAALVPPGHPVLTLAFGVNAARWLGLKGGPFTFRVELEEPWNPARLVVLEEELDPAVRMEDRGWKNTTIDLGAFEGRVVVLHLSVQSERAEPLPENLVGWRDPRFVRYGAVLPQQFDEPDGKESQARRPQVDG